MAARGNPILAECERRIRAEKEAQPVLTLCAFCRWHFQGSLKQGRQKHAAHRRRYHPEATPSPRKRINRGMLANQDIDSNIAAVREQGGATWVGGEAA